eukprot:jgi/Chrzof1/7546/Cz02g27250.t1
MDHHAAQGRKAIRQLARLIMSVLARSSLPRSGETTAMHAQDDGSIHASANVHGVLQSIQQQLVAEVHNTVHDALQTVQGSIQQQISEQVSGLTVPASSDSDINLKLQLIIDRLVQLQQSQQQARHSSTPGQLATSWQHLNGLDEQSELANTIRNISQAGVRMPTAQQLQGMADHTPNRIMSSDNMVGSVAEPVCSHLGGGSSSSSSSRMRRTDSDTLHSTHTAGQVDSQSSGVATDHDAPSATNSPFVNSRRSRSHLPSRAQQPDPYEAARDFLASHNVQSYFKGLLYCVMISTGVWCHGLIDDIKGEPMRLTWKAYRAFWTDDSINKWKVSTTTPEAVLQCENAAMSSHVVWSINELARHAPTVAQLLHEAPHGHHLVMMAKQHGNKGRRKATRCLHLLRTMQAEAAVKQ